MPFIDKSQPFSCYVDLGQEKMLCSQTISKNVCRFAKNVIPLHCQSARVLVTEDPHTGLSIN